MALLTKEQRKLRFKYLGLGEYNKANRLKFQKMAFPNNESEQDSKYGLHTDRALRTFYNVKKFGGGYFKPQEFRCTCGHCSGYPSYMKKTEMLHLAKIRKHYGKPMTITSGLRCAYENNRVGGVRNSGHTRGYAADFYMAGVTDTVEHRVKALKWIKKQDDHEFTYGAYMKDSNGLYRTASGMGNAMHTETHAHIKTPQDKICETAKKIADGDYRYMYYSEKYGKECPICHPHGGKNDGFNCIGYAFASWHHSGIPCRCKCDVITDQIYNQLLDVSLKRAKNIVAGRIGLDKDDFKVHRNGGKKIPYSKLKPGMIVIYYTSSGYKHTALWLGDGLIADCTSGRTKQIKYGVKAYTGMTIKFAIEYTGK